ncbi:MAG TPA: carboxypeptidase-like regulatory domain-containing protein [Holophagaceae bacterium]|nr:carboxypeptidase-like regulatory domain-containing protein [Holophagaceae bacterium]
MTAHRAVPLRGLALCLAAAGLCAGGDRPGGTPKTAARGPAPLLPAIVSRSDEELVLLRVRLGLQTLAETMPGYPTSGGEVLLPLGQLCRLLEIPIRVDLTRGVAEGTVGLDAQTFILDLGQRRVSRNGHAESLAKDEAELHEDDLYVSAKSLSRWFPVDIKVELKGSIANLAPREPLPIQQRWERERNWVRLSGAAAGQRMPPGVKPLDDPYRFLEVPMMDLFLQASRQPGPERAETTLQGALDLAGDFLGLNGRAYLSEDSATHRGTARITLGRHDPHGDLLGPLHAKLFEIGDVQLQGVDLVAPFLSGSGLRVDNWPLASQGLSDRRSFRGTLAPGWTVELYVNGALMAFQASRADGLYEFIDVQLMFGWNDVRIAFYGPGGEKREERYRYDLTQPPVAKGEFRYRFGALRPRGTETDEWIGELAYGFGKGFVAGGGFTRVPDAAGLERDYGSAFFQTTSSGLSTKLSLSSEQGGGSAAQGSIFSRLGSISVTLSHAELFNGYVSPVFASNTGLITRRTELGFYGSLPSLTRPIFSLGLNLRRDQLENGGSRSSILPRLSATYGRWYFTNLIDWEEQRTPGQPTVRQGNGDLLASRSFGRTTLRGDIAYGVEPARKLQSWGLQADDSRWAPWIFQVGYRESVQALAGQAKERSVQASASKLAGHFALGLGAAWSSVQGWTAVATFRIGLAREPFTGRWFSQASPTSSYGALTARGGVDTGTGVHATQGAPSVRVGQQFRPPVPGMEGVTFLPQLPPDEELLVQAGPSPEEPMLRSVQPGWTVVPRQGHITRLDALMEGTGEITGTAWQRKDGGRAPLAGIGLQVLDAQGQVAREFTSEYDGFFDLAELKPGAYSLRIAPESLALRKLADPGPRAFTIPKVGAQLDGLDLTAGPVQTPAPEPAAEQAVPPAAASVPPAPAPAPSPSVKAAMALPDPPSVPSPRPRRVQRLEAIRHSDWNLAYALSLTDLIRLRAPAFVVRAQVAALDTTVQEAMALFSNQDLEYFALPMTLDNGQCCPQLIIGGFGSRRAAQAFLRRLPHALFDAPPRVESVAGLLERPMGCRFHAH